MSGRSASRSTLTTSSSDQRQHRPEQLAARTRLSAVGAQARRSSSGRASPAMISRTSLTRDVVVGALGDLAAVAQHDDAVAEAQHLLELGGDEHHRHALARRGRRRAVWIWALAPMSMPRVGSSRMSSSRLGDQPARQQHLLLVAAARGCASARRGRRPDVERLDVLRRPARPGRLRDRPQPAARGLQREQHVVARR